MKTRKAWRITLPDVAKLSTAKKLARSIVFDCGYDAVAVARTSPDHFEVLGTRNGDGVVYVVAEISVATPEKP